MTKRLKLERMTTEDRVTYLFTACHGDTHPPALIVLSPTTTGWKSRSTSMTEDFDHDYAKSVSLHEIMTEWLRPSIRRPFTTNDREAVLDALTRAYPNSSWHAMGRFEGDPSESPRKRGQRLLQHLTCA